MGDAVQPRAPLVVGLPFVVASAPCSLVFRFFFFATTPSSLAGLGLRHLAETSRISSAISRLSASRTRLMLATVAS